MSRIARWRPSPSLVISCIALFVALGGSASALVLIGTRNIKNGAVTGRKIRNGTIKSRDVGKNALGPHAIAEGKLHVGTANNAGNALAASGLNDWAVVGANGVATRSHNLSSASRTGAGRYQVIFNRNVRNCAYVGSLGVVGATPPGSGEISTAQLASNVNGVFVRTFDSNGSAGDHSFHLLVSC